MNKENLMKYGAVPTEWEGCEGWSIQLNDRKLRIVLPKSPAAGTPWFWRPEFFGAFADTDRMLLDRGWALVFLDVPNHYGCPAAVAMFLEMHQFVTEVLGFAQKMGIVALSRAGLSAYNFASAYPDRVCGIYVDNPVCDFRSWPGGLGVGPGSAGDWQNLLKVYQLTDQEAREYVKQPISAEVLQPIVDAKIPVMHVSGDADEIVPFEENTVILREQFRALGGCYQEIIVPGGRHHPHGLPDPTPVVEFLEVAHQSSIS